MTVGAAGNGGEMERVMDEIKQFVKTVCERFDSLENAPEEDQKLPPAPVLETVCHVLHNVSCQQEEHRYPAFRVCFIAPESELLDMYVYSHVLLFERPLRFNAFELNKLFPALNINMSYLMLDISHNPFLIIGIIASYTEWERIVGKEVATGTRMPLIPNIAVRGPGKLEACFGENSLVSFNAGSVVCYRTDTFTSTIVADRLREGSHVSEEDRLSLLERIIGNMKRYAHGGQLFIVPSLETCGGCIDIKYQLPCRCLFRKEDTFKGIRGRSQVKELTAYADLVSKFTSVDGAVVLTRDFDLIGFGAEVIGDMTNRKPPKIRFIRQDGTEDPDRNFNDHGMRHRSGYRFCDTVEGAVGIILSQDGSVKVCTKREGVLYVFDNVGLPGL